MMCLAAAMSVRLLMPAFVLVFLSTAADDEFGSQEHHGLRSGIESDHREEVRHNDTIRVELMRTEHDRHRLITDRFLPAGCSLLQT
jgi:hypothetical protein